MSSEVIGAFGEDLSGNRFGNSRQGGCYRLLRNKVAPVAPIPMVADL
jgi:hypothetical protein